ncbi:GrpB domain, predicted nucleotidyltransferase, UPF0157 family [Halovenus aranensis]|jgi:GrpB-like predicted nucleotidyltransferase (UPF0157 family)|uniref:GrpB domain, predicted nucleotidyltransferase, UPF0157 family n=1 Tax=Halovenus aranensis TaxID=890420 RepID=A0A1G8XCX5_9EURY|nr:GrpB family protein [Halovenus aranensis]SDJ88246.1 GrpB domain, predicted nucleotidyltransferase, UPF0157 family [Halovenus aranensis]
MIGLERGRVELVPHDERWARLFEREADRLRSVLTDGVVTIEHVGSTAIAGVPAKPIIDILVVAETVGDRETWSRDLDALGYTFRPNDAVEDRHFFAKGPEDDRTHYLSITEAGSKTHTEQLAFRDYLREHPREARRYARVKAELAERFAEDRATYTESKSGFVRAILEQATE